MKTVLRVKDLTAGYRGRPAIHNVDLHVDAGEIVVLLGANGAGKTTSLRAISGMIRSTGTVTFLDRELGSTSADKRARLGLGHVPEGRGTLTQMTVEENLWAASSRLSRTKRRESFELWYDTFPRLRERKGQVAGSLSGGEQQLLAVSRALISEPSLLLLDEPSLGLAPLMIKEVFEKLLQINQEHKTAMLIVEQNAAAALSISHRAYVLESGRVVREGNAAALQSDDSVRRAYLGA